MAITENSVLRLGTRVLFFGDIKDEIEKLAPKAYLAEDKFKPGELLLAWAGNFHDADFPVMMEALNNSLLQYPHEFVEPGSGLKMRPELWYTLSESGSYYRSEGFEDVIGAEEWYGTTGSVIFPGYNLTVPAYDWKICEWGKNGIEEMSLVRGRDLWDFWCRADSSMIIPDDPKHAEALRCLNPDITLLIDIYLKVRPPITKAEWDEV